MGRFRGKNGNNEYPTEFVSYSKPSLTQERFFLDRDAESHAAALDVGGRDLCGAAVFLNGFRNDSGASGRVWDGGGQLGYADWFAILRHLN